MPDVERNHRPHIPQYRLPDRGDQLIQKLMGQNQAEPILAGLRQDRHKFLCGEVLKLVDEQEEVPPLLLRHASTGHGRQLKLGDKQGAQEIGLVAPKLPLGQVGDEEAAGVHGEPDVHPPPDLPQDVADDWIEKKLPQLVLDGGDGLALKTGFISPKLVHPKVPDKRVFNLADHPSPVTLVGEHPVHPQERHVLAVEEGADIDGVG